MNKVTIPIFYAIDDSYAKFVAVSIKSLIMNANNNYNYDINVIYENLSEENAEKLKSLETDNLYTIKGAYDFLSKIEEEQNKYTDAIYYNKQYRIYSDSIYVLTHTYDLAELQARYDHERLLNINNQLKLEKTNQ